MDVELRATARGHHLVWLERLVPLVVLGVTVGSLYVMWLNGPAERQMIGAAITLGGAVAAVVLQRFPWVSIFLTAVPGGVAVALTDREYFSFWPAGAALLALGAYLQSPPRSTVVPYVAVAAGGTGIAAAAVGPASDAIPPLLPVAGAIVLFLTLRGTATVLLRAQAQRDRADQLQHRAEASEAARSELEQRTALARDIHDSLGHHVTAMVVQAEAGQVDRANEALAAIADIGREALDELESVLFDLRRPPTGSAEHRGIDLNRIHSSLTAPLRNRGVRVNVDIATAEGDAELLAAAYRIIQEALTNVLRHAEATDVSVALRDEGPDLMVVVRDDGVGMTDGTRGGNGLLGMRERATRLGGSVSIVPIEPHGTLVEARIPRTAP